MLLNWLQRVSVFVNTLMQLAECETNITCVTPLAVKFVNKALFVHNWRLSMWIWYGPDGVNTPTSFGNSMELYKIRRNPILYTWGSGSCSICYGANPYRSQSTYGKCMELYQMSSNPIAIAMEWLQRTNSDCVWVWNGRQ